MKAITIKQPYASLIMEGHKRFEFRNWKTNFRGDILIHAGKGVNKEAVQRLKKYLPDTLPQGQIIGKVTITDCVPMTEEFAKMLDKENSDIYTAHSFTNNYGFQIENVHYLKEPIDYKGQLGMWNYEGEFEIEE